MKIIEALKKIKYLEKKAQDYTNKIAKNCVHMDYENPVYENQESKFKSWIQGYKDILKEISTLHYRIQKTNLMTKMKIELPQGTVEKTLTEWIIRRRKLADMELKMFNSINDRGLKEGMVNFPSGQSVHAKIKRYYNPSENDKIRSDLSEEPIIIDGKLEIINAVTDLLE